MSNLKERLYKGEKVLGTMINIVDHPDIVKILKACGFDYFIVDCEHGCMEYTKVGTLFAVAKEMNIAGMVRIPEVRREIVLKYMEMGADGLMLPNTNRADEARKLVEYAKYAPLGNRGVSIMRGHSRYEAVPSAVEYMKKANDETLLIIQVESEESVNNVEEIMDVEGIDVAFIGPNDLCQSLGVMGQLDHPKYISAVDKVIAAAAKKGKFSGIQTMNPEGLFPWIDKGMTFTMWANEVTMLMNSAKAAVKTIREK